MKGVERMFEPMTDKQYEGMLKDNIACLDRIAKSAVNDKEVLKQIFYERKLLESKLGYEIPDNNLYESVKAE